MWLPSTADFTNSLPNQAIFSAVFLLAVLTYKILSILASILISTLIISSTKDMNELQRMAKWGLIGKFVGFIVLLLSVCIRIFSAIIQTILIVFYSFIPFIVLGFVLMIIQDRWGDSAVMMTSMLNDPESPVALTIHYLIRAPLKVLDDVSFYVIPAYNFVIFVLIHIPMEFFANFLFGNGASLVYQGISSFAQSISLMVQTFASYIRANPMECSIPEPICWNYTLGQTSCIPIDKSTIATLCLDTYQRRLDAIPFLNAMMNGCSSILKALAMGCSSVENVINILCFPLTDPSLWKAIHYMLNSLMYVCVGAPTTTAARCALSGGFAIRPSLCTPDFKPAFDYAVSAAESLGDVIDNFVDMVVLLVVYGKNAECPRGSLTQHSLFLPVWKDPFIKTLFGSNSTSLVTLSTSLFALTDGQHSVYISHQKDVVRSYYPNAWGLNAVNPRFGIASISKGSAMLGCRCIDDEGGEMIVQCATSTEGLSSTTSFNSTWEIVNAGRFMQCSSVRVIVQSIRWPEQRVMLSENFSSFQTYTKLVADAVVYVIPTCGGNSNSLSCLDPEIFTLSNCYPYCMALHTTNSGLQPLLFRGYKSWMEGILITDRDCVPLGSIKQNGKASSSCSSDVNSNNPTISSSASSNGDMVCNYNPICSTWISNKSTTGQYSSSIPAFADTSEFVRNVLDGQPLLAAGGVIMRVSEQGDQRFVDFPIITGNQYNEFSMEVASPAGIPVAPLPPVISLSVSSEKKGFISLPPRYIEMIDIYNPATLSPSALWYAVNPSYDWISCFAKWCASEGQDTCVQIMFLSSYTPIRLWKVYYKSSACFVQANDGEHVCREDVAQGFALDTTMDLPPFASQADNTALCSNIEYNLWVESMEYYDELNIAVSVRRGTVKALYNLMKNVLRNAPLLKHTQNKEMGYIVIYFVHTLNTSLVRPLEPWTSVNGIDPGFLSVVHGSAVLCPELRFLPSFGTFFSQSLAALIHGIKMPVNLICNLFALSEVLTARAVHVCPFNGLGHSVLEDCGMALFDLQPFFKAIDEGNKAFWSILAWLASLIRNTLPSETENTALNFFESFITGASVYGEAGHIVNLFQVTDITETVLDTGVQDFVMGRRLLGGKMEMAKSVGKSAMSGILSVFTSGVQTLFSISQSLTDATAGKMSSVDFGILLSTMNPTYILGSLVTAPGIAWAQFTYETILPMALDLTSSLVYAKEFPKSTAIIWVRLHDAKDNYMKLIEPRMTQGCTGLRMMLGYNGGLPQAVYHNCLSASKMHSALFSLSIIILAEAPFYSCMCVKSNGYPFPAYIIENCMEWVPTSRKGLWQSILLNDQSKDAQSLCKWYGEYIHDSAMHIFDDWTYESHMAASSLASFLQDLIVPDAKNMGTCMNVQTNPNIFVMLPIPSEHYRVCGNTSECHLRCADTFAMFYYELNRYQSSIIPLQQSFDVFAESPFFNMYQTSSDTLYYIKDRILALSSRNITSSFACKKCEGGGCLVLAKSQWDVISTITISTFCTPPPSSILATVFASGLGDVSFDLPLKASGGFTLTYCNFALQEQDIYLILAYTSASMTVSSGGIFSFDATSLNSDTSITNQQKIYIVHDKVSSLLVDTDSLAQIILTPVIQDYVFEKMTVYNSYVKECKIMDFMEIYSGVKGQLIFFTMIMFTAKGWIKQVNEDPISNQKNNEIIKTGYVTAILTWCYDCVHRVDLFLPCACNDQLESLCQNPSYQLGSGCRAGIDKALYLAQRGSFLHVEKNVYLFIPKADSLDSYGKKILVQYVSILPDGTLTEYPIKAPSELHYAKYALDIPIKLYTPTSTTKEQLLRQELGFWSHSDVFSLSGLALRVLRSPFILNNTASPIRWLQAVQPTSSSLQWLKEVRINQTIRGFELISTSSQRTATTAKIQTKCSPSNCGSCLSSSVRLMCHALQDCMLSRCIGTTINYKNILCSVGGVVQQMYLQMVTSWRAVYLFTVELCMFVLNGFGGSLSQKIVLSFPTDLFYSLVCSCKDVFASFIGMGMSVVESVYGLFTTGRIDISVNTYVSPQDAVIATQTRSIGGLIFNIVADATLYPVLALHRWLLCITNTDLLSNMENIITVQFGDINMDQSWGICSPLSDKLSLLMDTSELENMMQENVNSFISFSMSLLSGIGETILYGMILMFDSMIAFMESIVWNIQNIMEAFNLRSCKVADYMQRVVLQCACGDTAYYIQKTQRESTWVDGALWCSGALSVTLTDGTQGVIYNPYSLQQLSDGLTGITEYIQCLSSSTSSQNCKKTDNGNSLNILTRQGVDPIAVWTKCKSNYIDQTWDIATGALFSDSISPTAMTLEVSDPLLRKKAQNWASDKAPEFLQCLQAPLRFYNDYSVCLKMFLNLTLGRLPNAYFLYTSLTNNMIKEPPDACLVFSGLNNSAVSNSPLQQTMQHCLMDQGADPASCPFNPTIWSASDPRKVPVAKLFGILDANFQKQEDVYKIAVDKLQAAFDSFNKTFLLSANYLQVALFSADGDFIHDFIDCVFLGPYTRVDMLPCDADGDLDCPFYARDENGGMHRNFTACFGDVMHGDGTLPFTCGSQLRRALIKYFFRDYSWETKDQTLKSKLTSLMNNRLLQLRRNLTNTASFGCLDVQSGQCGKEFCTRDNEYTPCLDMEFTISASNVSKFLLDEMLLKVDGFFTKVMHDTVAWTKYYNLSNFGTSLPAQWKDNMGNAKRAKDDGIFMPMEHVVYYDQREVYNMPSYTETPNTRFEGSVWSLCMALISQGQLSLALNTDQRPLGADDAFLKTLRWYDLDSIASAVRNLTKTATENTPFRWHKSRYHAPSQSAMCKSQIKPSSSVGARMHVGRVEFNVGDTTYNTPLQNQMSIPFHGFSWGTIGNAHFTCLCGYENPHLSDSCVFSSEACESILKYSNMTHPCIPKLQNICYEQNGQYSTSIIPEIWICLHNYIHGVRCPELGPSDSWGLFPMDCNGKECLSASQWTGNAQQDVIFEGIRLVTEGRAGLKLSNIHHVNATYHKTIDYSQQNIPPTDYQFKKCFTVDELAKDRNIDDDFDAFEDWIKGLFPATQIHLDSPVLSYCSRFVIEVARAEALSFVSMEASLDAIQQAKKWKRKCHSKIKHLTMCSRMGVYYDIPPPVGWKTKYSKHCDVQLDNSWTEASRQYLTPWCTVIDQEKRMMYDARICLRNAMNPNEKKSVADGDPITRVLYTTDLNNDCKLQVQPLDILTSSPVSSLYTNGAQRISDVETVELSLLFDEAYVQSFTPLPLKDDPISHVMDWWPDSAQMPVGFHITAPMIKDEFAPISFDSHYAFDPSTYTLHYIHSALRDESLLSHTAGTGGLCRVHNIGMPIFETNTNRICTRMPIKGKQDSPHIPIDTPKTEANIPQMGPYPSALLEGNFEEEICAASYDEVPWLSNSKDFAGSIPGVSTYLPMNQNGKCTYASNIFPPMDAVLLPVKDLYKDWGVCAGAVVWDDSPPCSENVAGSDCPHNTVCLKKGNQSSENEGICFSTAAFRIENTRPPCFRTNHCMDGLVCLADGGCSPLFLHMWNTQENNIDKMEFALMADNCGFQNPFHPFTQSMRGASPWEQVPDLLHKHGLCSHSNWFEYRNALRDEICPKNQCNLSEAIWPDVQMRFDGCRTTTTSTRFTMGQQYALHMVPHPCDRDYMHAALQDHRLQICSGYQGIQKGSYPGDYFTYDLNDRGNWEGVSPLDQNSPDTVQWMRTYTESNSMLSMGNLWKIDGDDDSRLGFLGADKTAKDPMLNDMAIDDGVRFFRCTDRMACQMPEYSYGGIRMEYRLDLTTFTNLSETSLRRCGAIGTLISETACRLDIELFPLFAYILKTENTQTMVEQGDTGTIPILKGCLAIWPKSKYLTSIISMSFTNQNWQTKITIGLLQSQPSTLFCSTEDFLCLYLPRTTTTLSEENRGDHVSKITDFLNSFFLDTTLSLDTLFVNHGGMHTYECINLCSQDIKIYTQFIQSNLQIKYNSSTPSGFYTAFQLSLYEFPQIWFHECMLSILLSHIDSSIPSINTRLMTTTDSIQLPLWSSLARMDFCSESIQSHKSGLYYIMCVQKHPEYSFLSSETDLLINIQRIIKEGIRDVAKSKLYENQEISNVECFRDAVWSNRETLIRYYSMAGCDSVGLDLCSTINPLYTYENSQEIPLAEISKASGTLNNMADFLTSSTLSIEKNADKQLEIIDYITTSRFDTENVLDYVTLASLKPIDTSSFTNYIDTNAWMENTCLSGIDGSCSADQSSLSIEKPCLFNENEQYLDADRYFSNNIEAFIRITVGVDTYDIDPCIYQGRNSKSYFVNQYELVPSLVAEDGPLITQIEVPPGIQVVAYYTSSEITMEEWKTSKTTNRLPLSHTFVNCAWKDINIRNTWWPDAKGTTFKTQYGNGFDAYVINFYDMNSWFNEPIWESLGCGLLEGVYAIEFRFERLITTNTFCSYATPYPLTSLGFLSRKPICNAGQRAFRIANSIMSNALWRCYPCTRYDPYIAKNGFFNCTLPGRIPMNNLFTTEMLQNTFDFLYSQQAFLAFIREKLQHFLTSTNDFKVIQEPGILKLLLPLKKTTLQYQWANCKEDEPLWECKGFTKGYDTSNTLQNEQIIWNKAISNPLLPFTMTCDGRKYTMEMQEKCNSKMDKKRKLLSDFVDSEYRRKNGIWLQSVSKNKGVAWKANVAHSAVKKFTLFYTSGDRSTDEITSKWVLSDGPCSQNTGAVLEDRICIESRKNNLPFEPIHPWIGGNYNPFAGTKGLDECPYIISSTCATQGKASSSSSNNLVTLCPCACTPSWACESTRFNYTKEFMDVEFPEDQACLLQKYSDTRVMNPNDPSNLCSIVQKTTVASSSSGCLYPHGLLGGGTGASVSAMEMHDKQGSAFSDGENPQELMDSYSIGLQVSGLWSGQKSSSKSIPFLRMRREFLHPSHIAFGLDNTLSTLPLIVKSIALLPQKGNFSAYNVDWVQGLNSQWVSEINSGIYTLYPQLSPNTRYSKGDWSCPIRKYAFFAGNDNFFGPLTPNPVVAQSIYGMGGVHPFIKTQGPYPNLAPYFTVNGACFFREDPNAWPRIPIQDVENQCGLRGMLSLLASQTESLMSVQESFGTRCNDIIDVPDVGGNLRSGEFLKPIPTLQKACGVLHRITPALIATKGDRGSVKVKSSLLTTLSRGGDCHMGRVFRVNRTTLQGHHCSTLSETEFLCDGTYYTLYRAKPLSLEQLLNKKEVFYRGDIPLQTNARITPAFIGPASSEGGVQETSFGLLYSATLKETLASDLLAICKNTPNCEIKQPLTGDSFLQDYINGTLFTKKRERVSHDDPLVDKTQRVYQKVIAQLSADYKDNYLWNQTDWTWTFLDHDKPPRGNLNKTQWKQNRTAACSASFETLRQNIPKELLQDSVRRISLCMPPPTGEMGELCNAMSEHKKNIVQVNCQLYGKGDCLSNLGMFYLPYKWSSTNQEYAFNRVSNYYKDTVLSKYPDFSCPNAINNDILKTLAIISNQQNSICPASSLEVFKDMLNTLKTAGHDLLYMGYTCSMMVANVIASVFTIIQGKDGSLYLETALRYLAELISYITKLLIPLLDIMIEVISTISPIGKAMKKILEILCIVYNWIMKEIIINVWCHFVRPVIIGILKLIQRLILTNDDIVNKIQDVLNYVGDGTEKTCVDFYNARGLMKCPADYDYNANMSAFQPQPMATLCWSNDGGGGIYSGVSQSLLSCTSSDTCASDPLLFDDPTKQGLIYCGSCPSVQGEGLAFGCDTYIQRCVCGIMDNSKTECTKNYDCSVPQDSMCGVSSKIEGIRNSYISVPCGSCNGMGMEPICMIDGQGKYGVCGCANVWSSLMTCTNDQIGQTTLALFSTEMCLTIVDSFKQNLIKETINLQTITLDFSEIAVVACSMSSANLCMDVSIPFSSTLGTMVTPMVVIVQLLSIIQPSLNSNRRRLLLSETDILAHSITPQSHEIVFNDWHRNTSEEDLPCRLNHNNREDTKRCLQTFAMAKYIVNHFNLSDFKGKENSLMSSINMGPFSILWTLQKYSDQKGLMSFIMDQEPLTKHARHIINSIPSLQTNLQEILQQFKTNHSSSRRLLFQDLNTGDWSFQCTSLQKPLRKITDAFWNTVRFYEQGRRSLSSNTTENNNTTEKNCSIDSGFASCISYSLPPPPTQAKDIMTMFQGLSYLTLYIPTLGYGGERVLDAILSPMDYNQAKDADIITGKRILYDMAYCNHTHLTLGAATSQRNFTIIFIALVVLFHIIATMCMPLSCCQWALWYFLFPSLFFWAMYNTSPLCWPMVPTNFVHDVYTEVNYYLPQDIKVPKFLVKPHCTLNGKLSDGSYDSSCFSKCSDPPFLFVSWQDSLIWWICEVSTEQCSKIGYYLSSYGSFFFKDMISSADYYASVIKYSSNDPEFVQAHRICAFISFYQIIFFIISVVVTCYLIPILLSGIMEAFMGCIVLLMDTYNAEM